MERLARYLKDTQTSQAALAQLLGVSQPTISDWIHGEKTPSADNLKVIATKTGLSIDELLGVRKAS
jgi:transcriptional regulator with XRE-family HTH domain